MNPKCKKKDAGERKVFDMRKKTDDIYAKKIFDRILKYLGDDSLYFIINIVKTEQYDLPVPHAPWLVQHTNYDLFLIFKDIALNVDDDFHRVLRRLRAAFPENFARSADRNTTYQGYAVVSYMPVRVEELKDESPNDWRIAIVINEVMAVDPRGVAYIPTSHSAKKWID